MTKRTVVLLPLLVIALVAVGCAGDTGGSGKAKSSFATADVDPIAEGLARGYISTVAADFTGNPNMNAVASDVSFQPVNRNLFQTSNLQMKAIPGQIGVTTLAPARTSQIDTRYDPTKVTATRTGDMIQVQAGEQTAMLTSVEFEGVTRTASFGHNGVAAFGDSSTFPRIVEAEGVGQGVLLVSGQLVPVE